MVLTVLHCRQEDGSSAGLGSAAHFGTVSPGYNTAAVQERSRQISLALGGCFSAHPAWPCSTLLGAAHPSR